MCAFNGTDTVGANRQGEPRLEHIRDRFLSGDLGRGRHPPGLVGGRAQTIHPWDSWDKKYPAEPDPRFHDVFRKDGAPHFDREAGLIRALTGAKQGTAPRA